MADYTTITDAQVDPEAPITSELMSALRDNPIAIAEGATGAPSVLGNIAANTTAGAVGSYVWARRTSGTTDVSFNSTLAGSSLSPTSGAAVVGPGLGGDNAAGFTTGSALSGTWRCMGTYDHTVTSATDGSSNNQTIGGATLWLRIA